MAFKLEIQPDHIILVIYSGVINKEEILAMREAAVSMIKKNEIKYFLIDMRKAKVDMHYIDLFNAAASTRHIYKEIKKTAFVYKPDPRTIELMTFFESTAVKRGFSTRLFESIKTARKWLIE